MQLRAFRCRLDYKHSRKERYPLWRTQPSPTPSANRLHIGFYGRRNSGQILPDQRHHRPGDCLGVRCRRHHHRSGLQGHGDLPVVGPCMLIDTAGFDDEGELGSAAAGTEPSKAAARRPTLPCWCFRRTVTSPRKQEWIGCFCGHGTSPLSRVINKADLLTRNRKPVRMKCRSSPGSPL